MILLCGIPSETPLEMVSNQLNKLSVPHVMFNQRKFATADIEFELSGGQMTGYLRMDDRIFRLEDFHSVYVRLMDDTHLPELEKEPATSQKRQYCRALHDILMQWVEIAPGRIINRLAAMGSNSSKPYQTQLIVEQGFSIPETFITNDPELAGDFIQKHKRVIYKSISGMRSVVQEFAEDDFKRLHNIRWCPVQFQVYVEGRNVRVHTIGGKAFATEIISEATDYRYSSQQTDSAAALRAVELPDRLAEGCVELAKGLGLTFAGIDLKITPEGEVYCFEVNPCPAFNYYEGHTGQPLGESVARYLAWMT